MSKDPMLQERLDSGATAEPGKRLKFDKNNTFQVELRRRVDDFFQQTGRQKRDCPEMYLKSAILLASLAAVYISLVFWAQTWWQAVPLSLLLGVVMSGIGFNIQHDGGHQAYSNRSWVNKLAAMTMDLLGGSSYTWHWKHAVFHHNYVNITGHDSDLEIGMFGRLSPHQPWLSFHRWQHIYLWFLYGIMTIKWQLVDDVEAVITERMAENHCPRPTGWNMVIFVAGKITFFTLAFVLPLLYHSVWNVLGCYLLVSMALGLMLSIVFQLAHAVQEADFPMPNESGRLENSWAVHQAETTVNFARNNPLVCWFLGGLNFQIEHHLFPQICHTNYPAIAPIVKATCEEFGVQYVEHESVWGGIVSHYGWLRRLGMRPVTQ
ncbi:fatty acid desaturase family protein [Leptolyngbya sp. AN02str]|uniref:fatty acid desaturase family protein n=1 Tax=Leptolyngbya sp. AN02str TaxID=3423363 RepID=UPI003D316BE2